MRGPVMRAVSGAAPRGLNLRGKDSNLRGKFRFGYEIGKLTVNSEIGAQDSGCGGAARYNRSGEVNRVDQNHEFCRKRES